MAKESYRAKVKRQGDQNARERELDNLKYEIERPLLMRINTLEVELRRATQTSEQLRRELHAVAILAKTIETRAHALASGKSEVA